jgi:hypothetical protein
MTRKRAVRLFLLNLVGFAMIVAGMVLFFAPFAFVAMGGSGWLLLAYLPMVAAFATWADYKTGARR